MTLSTGDRLAALSGLPELRYAVLAVGMGIAAAAYAVAAGRGVPEWERRLFVAINEAPDGLRRVLWPVMQLGSLGGGLVVAGAAGLWTRDPRAPLPIAIAAILAWFLAKAVKRRVGRGRPADFYESVVLREAATGLGFMSGHAAVAFATASASYPLLPPVAEVAALCIAATVAVARVYFGAHLPLDVIGGAGLGVAVGVATAMAVGYGLALVT